MLDDSIHCSCSYLNWDLTSSLPSSTRHYFNHILTTFRRVLDTSFTIFHCELLCTIYGTIDTSFIINLFVFRLRWNYRRERAQSRLQCRPWWVVALTVIVGGGGKTRYTIYNIYSIWARILVKSCCRLEWACGTCKRNACVRRAYIHYI